MDSQVMIFLDSTRNSYFFDFELDWNSINDKIRCQTIFIRAKVTLQSERRSRKVKHVKDYFKC